MDLENQPTAIVTALAIDDDVVVSNGGDNAPPTNHDVIPPSQEEEKKRGGICCGNCCDYRIAVIVMSTLQLCTALFCLPLATNSIFKTGLLVCLLPIPAAICGICGALRYSIPLVAINILWYIGKVSSI